MSISAGPTSRIPSPVDLEDLTLWSGPRAAIDDAFATLRHDAPRSFVQERSVDGARFGGYWSLTRFADVVDVSRRAADFCSGRGSNIVDMPADLVEHFGSIIAMDDPKHARIRSIVAKGFTPRTVADIEHQAEAITDSLIDDLITRVRADGECDFVTSFSALLPLRIIMNMMGIPASEEQFIFDATNRLLGSTDPEYIPDQTKKGLRTALAQTGAELGGLLVGLAEQRARDPRDDLITKLVTADTDGEKLTSQELSAFFNLLVGAGNETTRNAISHGLLALTNNPGQRALWVADFEARAKGAVEEIVRYASPVLHMRRTVTADGVRLGDHEFAEGDKVVIWYYSANRDEAVFTNPHTFDISRPPADHIAFGGPGPHFCLGAHLARREITVAFRQLLKRLPDICTVGDPQFLHANFINGVKHVQCTFTPPAS
jgi:cytochrome P450